MNISITDILSKWVGESEQRLHQIFETARRKSPTILFIDEVDALGVKRSDAGQMASMVNTLLTEIDGVESHNEDLLIIAPPIPLGESTAPSVDLADSITYYSSPHQIFRHASLYSRSCSMASHRKN